MDEKRKEHITGALIVALIVWALFHFLSKPRPRFNSALPQEGQSSQPNNAVVADNASPYNFTPDNYSFNLSPIGTPDYAFHLLRPDQIASSKHDNPCSCNNDTKCPLSPYTIASVEGMQAMGIAYGNEIINMGNSTLEAIAAIAAQSNPLLAITVG